MNPDHLPDELDDRIRAGLATVVADAPEPPPFEALATATSSNHGPARRLLAAAAVVVVLAAIGIGLALHDQPSDQVRATTPSSVATTATTEPPARADLPLYGTLWQLESAIVDGKEVEPTWNRPPTVRYLHQPACPAEACSPPQGPAFGFFDGCNGGSGSMEVEGNTITPRNNVVSTLVACTGSSVVPARALSTDGSTTMAPLTYRIDGDRLTLTSGPDWKLTYRAIDTPLVGTEWTIREVHDGADVIRVTGDQQPNIVLTFSPSGRAGSTEPATMSGYDGCNLFSSPLTVDGEAITPDQVHAGDLMCGANPYAEPIGRTLHGPFRAEVHGSMLVLTSLVHDGLQLVYDGPR